MFLVAALALVWVVVRLFWLAAITMLLLPMWLLGGSLRLLSGSLRLLSGLRMLCIRRIAGWPVIWRSTVCRAVTVCAKI